MVGVVTTRVQEVYSAWGQAVEGSEKKSINLLRNFGLQSKKQRILAKECDSNIRSNSLYEIKEQPAAHRMLPVRPVVGLACKHCARGAPTTAESQVDPIARRGDVQDILLIGTQTAQGWAAWCPHLAQVWRHKKFDYPQVADTVLKDERLQSVLTQGTRATLKEKGDKNIEHEDDETSSLFQFVRAKHEARARRILLDMRSKLSDFMLRLTSWVMYKLLPCFLTGVAAHPAQIEMLRNAAEKAGGVPLIFMPLHRSHLDYILVTFILLNNDIRSPLVAAGNNLRIPFFGSLLRGLGAFYIKRRIDPILGKKDLVYRSVLHTYLQQCLGAGHNIEFFIEGGRTRTGKPCMPKGGILSVIVDAYMDGTVPDVLLVPVSVNYERLVDGNFIHEQLGQKKQMESFGSTIKAILSTLNSNYGVMRINFNEPFSIRELVKSFRSSSTLSANLDDYCVTHPSQRRLKNNPSCSSLYGTDVDEEHRTLVESIARHVIYDSANATAVMSTNAVAFLLLTQYRNGCDLNQLTTALDTLRTTLERSSRDLGFTGDSKDVIEYAIKILGPALITEEKKGFNTFIKPVTILPNVIELAYYSNCLVPHFALESIVITCLHSLLPERMSIDSSVEQEELVKTCLDMCETLRYEFILSKPCQSLRTRILETIDGLSHSELIYIPQKFYSANEQWSQRFASTIEGYDSDEEFRNNANGLVVKVNMSAEAVKRRRDVTSVLAPLIQGYICTAQCLDKLLGGPILESEFTRAAVLEAQGQVDRGENIYAESVSLDTMRNAVKLFEKWGILELSTAGGVRMVGLGNHWDNPEGVGMALQCLQKFTPKVIPEEMS